MSSLPSLQAPGPDHFWPARLWTDRATERKSGNCAALLTLILLLAAHAVLLLPDKPGASMPLGDAPLTVEFRRLPPPEHVILPEPEPEIRKLLAEEAQPEQFTVPEPPPLPKEPEPVKEIVKPKPVPKPAPKKPAPVQAKSEAAPVKDEEPAEAAPPARAGHASGETLGAPDAKGHILAALLHAVEANKEYPRQARRAGIQGKVTLRVSIGPDGRVIACSLAEASGKRILDAATQELGDKLIGLDIPSARGRAMQVLIPVQYTLKR